jgi:hypothetical protein
VLSFIAGLHFALLQTSYFLLLEAHLSSQSLSYFVTLFFWLTGLLLGLFVGADRWFSPLLGVGILGYYVTFALTRWIPFHGALYAVAAIASVISGLLPGFFFRFAARRWVGVRSALFHENNGFLLGLFVCLRGAIHFGGLLVALGPLLCGAALGLALWAFSAGRDEGERLSGNASGML